MENINPLAQFNINIDLAGVDTSMPVLETGHYILEVDTVEVKENKEKTGNNLVVACKTCAPANSVQGRADGKVEDIKAGFPVKIWLPLRQSTKSIDAPDFRKRLAEFQDAVEGSTKETRNPDFNPFNYKGMKFVAALKVVDDEQYGLTNNVGRLSAVPA